MSRHELSGHFIPGAKGKIFVLARGPVRPARGTALVVPPFAEEMNKSRRMVTEVAVRLADRGIRTVVPDLFGTGDSEGDFADTDWMTWQGDLVRAAEWSGDHGFPITGILAIRLGCALAQAVIDGGRVSAVERSVLWQPIFDGSRFVAQFLRTRVAAGLMNDRKESVNELRSRLQAGEGIDVAGYCLAPRLASEIEAVSPPTALSDSFGEIAWLEVVREAGAGATRPSEQIITQTLAAGRPVILKTFAGDPFWASTEIVCIDQMIDATVAHLSSGAAVKHGEAAT